MIEEQDRYDDYLDGDYLDDDQDDGLDADDNIPFECARFWIRGEGWFCPIVGTEECDWDCPE